MANNTYVHVATITVHHIVVLISTVKAVHQSSVHVATDVHTRQTFPHSFTKVDYC